jgi:hypothetical protein
MGQIKYAGLTSAFDFFSGLGQLLGNKNENTKYEYNTIAEKVIRYKMEMRHPFLF